MIQKVSIRIIIIVIFKLTSAFCLFGQEAFLDPAGKFILDSLDHRIKELDHLVSSVSGKQDVNYFYNRRELDLTVFLNQYYTAIFDEDIDLARETTELHLKAAVKRRDDYSTDFYKDYEQRLTNEIQKQWTYYQFLFKKEKNFKTEFYKYFKTNDVNSLNRCKRFVALALKYATEKNLDITLKYLAKYEEILNAHLYSRKSEFELDKLTQKESIFKKEFCSMLESDSLAKASRLVEECYQYAAIKRTVLDTNFFKKQRIIALNALNDYNERNGNNSKLQLLNGKTTNARFDSLNNEGIYKWHDKIIVVGLFTPKARFDNVKKGEAISDADHRLLNYIRVNRLAKLNKEVKIVGTQLIPFIVGDKLQDFKFNPVNGKYQYMVCYSQIGSNYFTQQISRLLPPIEFKTINNSP